MIVKLLNFHCTGRKCVAGCIERDTSLTCCVTAPVCSMNHARSYHQVSQNDIRTVFNAGYCRQVAENCQKLQSVVDTLMMCETE